MKKLMVTVLVIMMGLGLYAQAETDAVVRSFKTANVDEIAQHFDEFVDLKLLDKDEVKNMSKNQAALALKSFFAENGVKGFDKVTEGGKGTLLYLVGKLNNSNKGNNITIQLKQKSGVLYIITLRIS